VQAIALAHGGAAHARNTIGGADVWISLPNRDGETERLGGPSAAPEAKRP
jgi:hypothetical protein